ncbi:hypothetical protein [Sphingomonas rhizophila]|uniref:phage terminase large subunit family protein n=1 Tax=Sphingomonas rhizophila TaxID=2071607 RepID=UPI001FECCA1E|nr:hypothetical protein [Sphingomonas rhizophila]
MMGLRRGEHPRCLITTTPRPTALMTRILSLPDLVVTGGRTADNPHLPPGFVAAMMAEHGGTRLGAQELDGVMVEGVEDSLFPREMLRQATMSARMAVPYQRTDRGPADRPTLERIVVGVDPPAGIARDACGIVVMGTRRDGLLIVLDDRSVHGLRPEGWARAVARAADEWRASRVVAEANQGGEMVRDVLRAADCTMPVRLVRASRGKGARAEAVAAMMEAGKLMLLRRMGRLEDELSAMTVAGYAGVGSPDRADAMVWAAHELMRGLARAAHEGPRVRMG